MTTTINGSTGIDKVVDGAVVQADLTSGVAGTLAMPILEQLHFLRLSSKKCLND